MSRQIAKRILIGAVDANFEMQVGTGRISGRSLVSDGLAAVDPVPAAHGEPRQMGVERAVAVAVGQDDDVAVAPVPTLVGADAGVGSQDGRAGGGADGQSGVKVMARAAAS